MPIEKGNKVKVEYKGTLENGEEFDSSERHGHPLEFEAGSGMMIKGFDEAVIGMEKDEEKTITLNPEDAYGQVNEKLIQKVPKSEMPQGQEPKVGMVLGLRLPDGNQIPARIVDVSETEVTLDLNHPLAGKKLNFWIKVVDYN